MEVPIGDMMIRLFEAKKIILISIILDALILIIFGSFLLSHVLVKPLKDLVRLTQKISEGDFSQTIEVTSKNEIGQLIDSFNRMILRLKENQESLENYLESLETTNTKLKEAQEELLRTEKLASIGRFAAGVAHEVGNPLGAILGYTSILEQEGIEREEAKDYLKRIEKEIERINRIVRELLDFARPSKLERKEVDVNKVIEKTLSLLSYQKNFKDIQTQLDLQPDLPLIKGDETQLSQVFINMILNAIDAMPEGGRLNVQTKAYVVEDLFSESLHRIYPRRRRGDPVESDYFHLRKPDPLSAMLTKFSKGDTLVRIQISDTGTGITKEDLKKIFDPFFTTKDPDKGTGLGLSVSLRIVESIGGEIKVESELGKGTKFEVYLPAVKEEAKRTGKEESMGPKRILIIDDEESFRHMLSVILKREGFEVETASDGEEGLQKVMINTYDQVLCDIRMPRMDGLDFLKEVQKAGIDTTLIMMSAYGTVDTALEAMKLGAYDYISKPFKPDEIILTLKKADERERLRKENERLRKEVKREYSFENIVSKNEKMQKIFEVVKKVAPYKSTILIMGESGTGKELVARALHYSSDRSQRPFIPVNCGAIPENLLESELFGHAKGAFTDAIRTKKGLFEEADGGTLFLDEIGELPLSLQVKLLRVLQDGEIRRVGEGKPIQIDVRIVAATAKDLIKEVNEGRFREDLFYRLNVFPIHLPPLRERKEDIPLLATHFIKKYSQDIGKYVTGIHPRALEVLINYRWFGNVRELENTIERAIVLADGSEIERENLPIGDPGISGKYSIALCP